jgi:hypothetical protein
MTSTLASTSIARHSTSGQLRTSSRSERKPPCPHPARRAVRTPLARYTDRQGRPREVIVRRGLAGSVLVVDRDAITQEDCLLVAHLCADEPPQNAQLVCANYIHDVCTRAMRCRRLSDLDEHTSPLPDELTLTGDSAALKDAAIDAAGHSYRLERMPVGMLIPALRWCRSRSGLDGADVVSLRQAIAQTESYEPLRRTTIHALAHHRDDATLSTAVLGAELARVQESQIVLNRRLREAVLAKMQADGISMSEMAIRCGRLKRDSKGNESGETSWLARRLGLLAESGQCTPTPWVHTDVLALIARRGLGVSPREVEVS